MRRTCEAPDAPGARFRSLERDHEAEAAGEREAAQIELAPVVGSRFETHDHGGEPELERGVRDLSEVHVEPAHQGRIDERTILFDRGDAGTGCFAGRVQPPRAELERDARANLPAANAERAAEHGRRDRAARTSAGPRNADSATKRKGVDVAEVEPGSQSEAVQRVELGDGFRLTVTPEP